jgi:hypothetical protein
MAKNADYAAKQENRDYSFWHFGNNKLNLVTEYRPYVFG